MCCAEISGATTEAARAKVTEWHPFGANMEEQVRKLLPAEVSPLYPHSRAQKML